MALTDDNELDNQPGKHSANTGYVLGQLARAFETSETNSDDATRARARRKIGNWAKVFQGIISEALAIGSRLPISDIPAWATLEVIHGGFATGGILAEGQMKPHELELLSGINSGREASPRAVLNSYYLTDAGISDLQTMLMNGGFRINVPEEGALLVIAWLLANGQVQEASEILDEIGNYFPRLRFYPEPSSYPLPVDRNVHVQTAGETIKSLGKIKIPKRLAAQREATQVWAPLGDRVVELFLETVEGPVPSLLVDSDGKLVRTNAGVHTVQGGWPCQHYGDAWKSRAITILDEYHVLRNQFTVCGKIKRKTENTSLLLGYLHICAEHPKRLTGRDVSLIRRILASITTRRGEPSSPRCRELREYQASLAERPTNSETAIVIAERIKAFPADLGIDALDGILAPITEREAHGRNLFPGHSPSASVYEKVLRCKSASVESLVECNVITSGETLAKVFPQITANTRASGLSDSNLRRLYISIYKAFRRRRSLLLLNLESQVKLKEIPWVAPMDRRNNPNEIKEIAGQTLGDLVTLVLTAFPHQILPNKLIQEIRILTGDAGIEVPLVDDMAADIFMGAFTEKFVRSAQLAATLMEGTLYEHYFGISYEKVRAIDDMVQNTPKNGPPTSPAFFKTCMELVGPAGKGSRVAYNGTIIEQEQILTTHNLAALYLAIPQREALQSVLPELARRCFTWICRRHRQTPQPWKSRLRMVKNSAYAWRQMVFYLSLVPAETQAEFMMWAFEQFSQQKPEFQAKFKPALVGLNRAMQGLPVTDPAALQETVRFLGWTTTTHWLLQ